MKCADCKTGEAFARGLCRRCYHVHDTAGDLCDFPRSKRPRADVVEDWLFLAAQGYTRKHAAARMGMTRDALDHAIARANRDAQKATAA